MRDILAIALAVAAIGVSFGAIAVAVGVPAWLAIAMSLLVFAGGAQFIAVGLIGVGNPIAAVAAGLLVNLRYAPFGLVVGDLLERSWGRKLVGSHLLTDEGVAFTLAQPTQAERQRAYWLTGAVLFAAWQLGTGTGVFVGSVVGDPGTYGLDAAFPAGLIALLRPSFADRRLGTVALAGAALAIVLTPFLPAGLPVMAALVVWPLALIRRPASGGHTSRPSAEP